MIFISPPHRLQVSPKVGALGDIDIKNPLQTPSPGHCYVVFQRLVFLSLRGCFAFFLPLPRSVGVINSEFAAERHQFLVVARLTGNPQEAVFE